MAAWVSRPSGSHHLLMAEVSGQADFLRRNCRLLCWLLCRELSPQCTATGICGKSSLTGKSGLAEKKPQPLAPGCTPALRQLVHMKGFQQNVFNGKSMLLEESSCFWQHLVETLILCCKPAFGIIFVFLQAGFNWSFML